MMQMIPGRKSNVIQDEMISICKGHKVIVRLVDLHPGFSERLKSCHFEAYYSLDEKCSSYMENDLIIRLPAVHGGYSFGPSKLYGVDMVDENKLFVGWSYDRPDDRNEPRSIYDVMAEAKRAVKEYERIFGENDEDDSDDLYTRRYGDYMFSIPDEPEVTEEQKTAEESEKSEHSETDDVSEAAEDNSENLNNEKEFNS